MSTTPSSAAQLSPELERLVIAAEQRLRATVEQDEAAERESGAAVRTAGQAAMDAGSSFAMLAAAEAAGEGRARDQLRAQTLRRVRSAAKARAAATEAWEDVIRAGGRLGLSDREIAGEAQTTHRTVHAIIARAEHADAGLPGEHHAADPDAALHEDTAG